MSTPLTDEQVAEMLSNAAKVNNRLFCGDETHRLLSGHVEVLAAEVGRLNSALQGGLGHIGEVLAENERQAELLDREVVS